jgi:hypothetical protein
MGDVVDCDWWRDGNLFLFWIRIEFERGSCWSVLQSVRAELAVDDCRWLINNTLIDCCWTDKPPVKRWLCIAADRELERLSVIQFESCRLNPVERGCCYELMCWGTRNYGAIGCLQL